MATDLAAHVVDVEIREQDGRQPMIAGVIIQEGRAARGRRELFAPGSIAWPQDGVGVLARHYGPVESRGHPVRLPDGRLELEALATPALLEAYQAGRKFLSVEFHALREHRTAGGIREIVGAFVTAAALVERPEYAQATAEVRAKSDWEYLLWL